MKKIAVVVMLSLAMLLALVACGGDKVSVTGISVAKVPTKVTYALNEEFDPSGGELNVQMSNGDKKVVSMTDEKVTFENTTTDAYIASKAVKVFYEGFETTFPIKVVGVRSITVHATALPKLVYNMNETFSRTQGSVSVEFTDNSTANVPFSNTEVEILNFNSTVPGKDKEITVRYRGATTTLKVTVLDQTIESIEVKSYPVMEYMTGDEFDTTGGVLYVFKLDGSIEEVPFSHSDVKIIYNFTERVTGSVNNNVVKVQYRGYELSITVQLDSEVVGISNNVNPQLTYIVGEEFNRSSGSVFLHYQDGGKTSIPLSNTKIQQTGFNSASAGTCAVEFFHEDYPEFKTNPLTFTIVESAATAVIEIYNQLHHIELDFVNGEIIGVDPATDPALISEMFTLYEGLANNDKTRLNSYRARIVGLAFAVEYMALYNETLRLNAIDVTKTTYESALVLIGDIGEYITDVNTGVSLMGKFSNVETIVLQRQDLTTYTISSMKDQMNVVRMNMERMLTSLEQAKTLFIGYTDIPNNLPINYNFLSHTGIFTSYTNLKALNIDDARFLLPVLENWRSGYREIMLEYLYQRGGNSIEDTDVVAFLEYAPPDIFAELTVYSLKLVFYAYPLVASTEPNPAAYYAFVNLMRDRINIIYSSFPSMIVAYEEFLFVKNDQLVDDLPIKAVYDSYKSIERSAFQYFTGKSFYKPSEELQGYLDVFFPIIDAYAGDSSVYYPGSTQYDADVVKLKDAFYSLSTFEQYNALYYYDHGYFFAIIKDYMKTHLGGESSNEFKAHDAFDDFLRAYLSYVATGDESLKADLDTKTSTFNTRYNAISNKNTINKYMSIELEFVSKAQEWMDAEFPKALLPVVNNINSILYFQQNQRIDETAALYYGTEKLLEELLTNDYLKVAYETAPLSSFDGESLKYYFDEVGNMINSMFQIDRFDGSDVAEVYVMYMDLIYDIITTTDSSGNATVLPGTAHFDNAVEELRDAFFALSLEESLKFIQEGNYILNAVLLQDMFAPYLDEKMDNEEALDVYLLAASVMASAFAYDVGYVSLEGLMELNDEYVAARNELEGAALTAFEMASEDVAYVERLIAFLTDIEQLEADERELVRLITRTLEVYNSSYNTNIEFEGYYRHMLKEYEAYEAAHSQVEIDAFLDFVPFPYNTMTIGEALTQVMVAARRDKILQFSDDDASLDVYYKLADAVYKFNEVPEYTIESAEWAEDAIAIFEGYNALSGFQQTAIIRFQTGVASDGEELFEYNYYNIIVGEYFINLLASGLTGTAKTNMETAIARTLEMQVSYSLFTGLLLSIDNFREACADAVTAYNKLANKTAFNSSDLGAIYRKISDINTAYAAGDNEESGIVVSAVDIIVRIIESYKLYKSADDATYVMLYMAFSFNIIPSLSDQQKNLIYNTLKYEDITLGVWWNDTIPVALAEIAQAALDLDVFYSRFMLVAERYTDGGGAIYTVYFTEAYYESDFAADVNMLIDAYELLTTEQQEVFNATFGHIYRSMLRYYYSTIYTTIEYLDWYDEFTKQA